MRDTGSEWEPQTPFQTKIILQQRRAYVKLLTFLHNMGNWLPFWQDLSQVLIQHMNIPLFIITKNNKMYFIIMYLLILI